MRHPVAMLFVLACSGTPHPVAPAPVAPPTSVDAGVVAAIVPVASDTELEARHDKIVAAASTRCVAKMQPGWGLVATLVDAGAPRSIVRAAVEAQAALPDLTDEVRKWIWSVGASKFAELGEVNVARTMLDKADAIEASTSRGLDTVDLDRTRVALGQPVTDRWPGRLTLRDVPLLVKVGALERANDLVRSSGNTNKTHYAAALLAVGRGDEIPDLVAKASNEDAFWLLYGWVLGASEQHRDVAAAAAALAAHTKPHAGINETKLEAVTFARRYGHAREVTELRHALRSQLDDSRGKVTLGLSLYLEALVVDDQAEAAVLATWLTRERPEPIDAAEARAARLIGALYRNEFATVLEGIRRFDRPSPREVYFVSLWLRHVSTTFDPAVDAQLAEACANL